MSGPVDASETVAPLARAPQALRARLVLEDGSVFPGRSFGFPAAVSGEVVFNTGMVGYPEALTDPSYRGQILTLTYPLIGNYGVPARRLEDGLDLTFESGEVQVAALVVGEVSPHYSHWSAARSLEQWLTEQGVPGLTDVDTRTLTKRLREHGVMLGKILAGDEDVAWRDPNQDNLVSLVSVKEPVIYGSGARRVVVVDCGCKNSIIRSLTSRGLTVIRVPWDYDFLGEEFHGVVVSSGPGDPKMCDQTIAHVRLRHMPGPSDPGPGRGGGHLQAEVRPSRPEPAVRVGGHQPLFRDLAEPRVCGGRAHPPRRLGRVVPQRERRHQRGDPPPLPALQERAVPPGCGAGAGRHRLLIRRVRGVAPWAISPPRCSSWAAAR
jgi:Carbamoyl-phosphate synthase small chain, CPSase domain/Glutamine amidotransferase class-I